MNISRWTIDEKMQLPDFCFGQRKIVATGIGVTVPKTMAWNITSVPFPDSICIWEFGILPTQLDSFYSYCRVGLTETKPTSEAEMDAAIPILPDWTPQGYSPPRIYVPATGTQQWVFKMRKGMKTKARKMAIELYANVGNFALVFYVIYSKLPTNISGFLAHSFFTKVR